jgi:hypothetical protein
METRYCPNCGTANEASFRFCKQCGAPMAEALPPTSTPVPSVPPSQRSVTPSISPPPPKPAHPPQAIGQMGTGGFSAVNIWGPFAGHGQRGRHVSWLLDDLGERSEALREAIANRFSGRQIPSARFDPRILTGKGIVVERRPYYLIRRGIATAALYISRFGQDLYISQVTYAKGAINPLRTVILASMVLFQLYLMFGYATSVESSLGSVSFLGGRTGGDPEALGLLLCCVGPLGMLNTLGLFLAGLHMAYKFLTERDPLALLRTPPNEFQQDDIIALEKAVEETVRQSLDAVGIDSALMPPAPEYGIRRRLI